MYEWDSIDTFAQEICYRCTANEWYCPTECDFLIKARRYPIDRINKTFNECGEDYRKLTQRIKSWK